MDDFSTFARDFGLRPQGKSAPMTQSKPDPPDRPTSSSPFPDFDYDNIFKTSADNNNNNNNNSINRASSPVYDKPVYDEDIFDGLPGVRNKSGSGTVSYDENVFATMGDLNNHNSSNSNRNSKNYNNNSSRGGVEFDDLLGNLGRREKLESRSEKGGSKGFDDLLQGFGASSSPHKSSRSGSDSSQSQKTNVNSTKPTTSMADDPFAALNPTSIPSNSSPKVFIDPLDEIGKLGNYANTTAKKSFDNGPVFDDIDPLDGFGKSAPAFSSGNNKEHDPSRPVSSDYRSQSRNKTEPIEVFDIPSVSTGPRKSVGQMASPSYVNPEFRERNIESPGSDEHVGSSDDAWLTVSEIPLFTQPTTAPPPSRPPPPIPGKHVKSESGFYNSNSRKKANEFSSYSSYTEYSQSPKPLNNNMGSTIDDLESFAMGKTRENNGENVNTHGSEDIDTNSSAAASAAAMKEAMDRAEAKFRHAKEVKERENAKTSRNRESVQVDEQVMSDEQERENRENEERFLQEQEERRRVERERERAREEREKARQAVQRATREARERAAIEARERAAAETRRKSDRAAVDRAQAEARERAERAAVQRAQNEARERAAADAREKAEKAEREARERVNAEEREKAAAKARADAEARRRSDRAAVDRAAAEARERAASAAWTNQRNNDNARMNQQQKNDNDLESFFSSRASSAPRPREPTVDPLFQSTVGSEQSKRTSSVSTSANMKKTSSATSFVDDLSSIFGGTGSSGNFQEVEGETGERRKARLDRHQRTQERAAKALAEKNQRDLQSQREQEERSRIGETLDIEVRRWAAGKEGNLRALLSTLQYVLWPECGWTPVSLTDLITGASVKKVYRKATLCIHPDKVQQKGANLQQKYIAEKVFDLLKEAWNKFNSEELF